MKKIIFGITGLTLGGAERVLVDLANKLVNKYDITIFTLYSGGELEKELDPKVHLKSLYDFRYDSLGKIKKKVIPLKVLFGSKKIFKKYVANEEYTAQIAFLEGPITRIFKYKSKAKKIAWVHNDISKVFGNGIKSKIKRMFDRNVYEKYDELIFVSISNLDKFNKVYDDMMLPKERVINNYIDSKRIIKLSEEELTKEEESLFNKKDIVFLQVSRLVKQKAIDRLIEAHSKLIKEGYNHKIYVVGDGPEKESLKKQIEEKNVKDTFILLGAKTNPYKLVKKADYFCLFSAFEGYPMVLEEAKILNKYILTTNTSSREVLVNYSKNSYITENSEDGIYKGIKRAIINKEKNLKNEINYQYDNDKIINKVIKALEE